MSELVIRMKEFARAMFRDTACDFTCKGDENSVTPSLEFRRNIFPMFKEILHNISRHSRATHVDIQIIISSRHFRFEVRDNGVGFAPDEAVRGNGLKNLRRRAAELKGTVEINSVPGQGTNVSVTAPIP
jgi:signal transduction histidine kinase